MGQGMEIFQEVASPKKQHKMCHFATYNPGSPAAKLCHFRKKEPNRSRSPMSTDPRLSPLTIDYNCSLAGEQTEKKFEEKSPKRFHFKLSSS